MMSVSSHPYRVGLPHKACVLCILFTIVIKSCDVGLLSPTALRPQTHQKLLSQVRDNTATRHCSLKLNLMVFR